MIFFLDSVIYIDESFSYKIPIGEALGEFLDELSADDFIVEFISVLVQNHISTARQKVNRLPR